MRHASAAVSSLTQPSAVAHNQASQHHQSSHNSIHHLAALPCAVPTCLLLSVVVYIVAVLSFPRQLVALAILFVHLRISSTSVNPIAMSDPPASMTFNIPTPIFLSLDSISYTTLALLVVVGGLTGVFSSFVIACTLVELTISGFFAFYFGVLLLFISGLLYYRLVHSHQSSPHHYTLLLVFIALLFASSILALLLHPLLRLLPALMKVPLYTLFGLSLTFSFAFSLFDVLNYAASLYQKHTAASSNLPTDSSNFAASSASSASATSSVASFIPSVNTQQQVYILAACSGLMGIVYGLTFSLMDIEDLPLPELRAALMADESICYPVGFVLGAVGAVLNGLSPPYSAYDRVGGGDNGLEEEFGL